MDSAGKPSSTQSSSRQLYNTIYVKDPLRVQRELIEAIDPKLLPKLQALFYTKQWEQQNDPVPRHMIRPLCSCNPQTNHIVCVFCPDSAFVNTDRAIEHIQKDHLGLRPFCCREPNWWDASSLSLRVGNAQMSDSGRTFLRNNELTNHIRTHKVPTPVACPNKW